MRNVEDERELLSMPMPRALEPYAVTMRAHDTNHEAVSVDLRWSTSPPRVGKLVIPPGGQAAYRGRAPEHGVRLALTVRLHDGDRVELQLTSGTDISVRQELSETQQIQYVTRARGAP